jgi:hypothetical protein
MLHTQYKKLFATFWVATIPEKVLEREREKCLTLISWTSRKVVRNRKEFELI